MKKEKKLKIIIDMVFVISILSFMFCALAKSILKPNEIVDSENRYANKYNKITFKDYLTGDLQTNFEETLSDQIIFSSKLKSANNLMDGIMVKASLDVLVDNENLDYYNLGSIYSYGNDSLVYYPYVLDEYMDELMNKVAMLNKTISEYPEVEYYFYYIEKDTDINFKNNSKLMAYEYLQERLNSSNVFRFEINNFEEFKQYFYKTDHHWNLYGSYKAYEDLLSIFDIDNPKIPNDIDCFNNKFIGSKAMSYSFLFHEKLCYYNIDYDTISTYINGEEGQYGFQGGDVDNNISYPAYHTYYGFDRGEVIFNSNDDSKENILIIGESFDNAIIRLLAEKFNITSSIDLRHYERDMGNKFNYEEYLKEYNIDKVLFIGNINYWVSEEFDVIG